MSEKKKTLQGVKKSHGPLGIPNRHQECKGIQRRRGTTSTGYFMCKSRTNKTGLISKDTRSNRRQRPKNQKVNLKNTY